MNNIDEAEDFIMKLTEPSRRDRCPDKRERGSISNAYDVFTIQENCKAEHIMSDNMVLDYSFEQKCVLITLNLFLISRTLSTLIIYTLKSILF